jgi:hypothetical protein
MFFTREHRYFIRTLRQVDATTDFQLNSEEKHGPFLTLLFWIL